MEPYRGDANMIANLHEGATDGSYRKIVRDRGGIVEDTTYRERQDMADVWYGLHEASDKNVGDGTRFTTPDYRTTPNWRLT